jgi:choline dehydrogenase-like flavoprotein
VGKNFQDHLAGMLRWERKPGASPKPEYFRDKQAQKAALREWELFRTGPAASIGCAISLGFFKSDAVLGSEEYAALPEDERKHLSSPTVPTHEVGFAGIDPIYYIAPETAPELATCSVILHNLQSRGTFNLQSADPAVPLAFDVGYLEHPYDRRVAIEAMRETVLVTRTEAFLKDNVACLNEPESTSDADLLKWWQQNGNTSWHMSSTCAMGKDQEKDHAVVDTDCKVFGVQKLRVADMSVFPFLPSSHTQTAAYLVGLIAADKIIAEHELA